MKKLQNLKTLICSYENLYAAYLEAIKGKKYRDDVLLFSANLEENLLDIRRELLEETYTVGAYHEFYVMCPKPRLVMSIGFRDQIVQWAIYRQINPFADKRFIAHSYGCRKGKGTLAAAECLLGWMQHISRREDAQEWVVLKGDISKYFYRVNHEKALEHYAEYSDDPWFLHLMGRIIDNPDVPFGLPRGMRADDCPKEMRLYDVGMPIGNLISQETANIYLDHLDQYCKHVLKLRYYARYMDDFCILVKGREEAGRILAQIERFLREELMLELSPKSKILPAWRDVEFVGYVISPHGMRLRKRTQRHIKRALVHMAKLYNVGAVDFDACLQVIRCYIGMTKYCNGFNLRRWIAENIVMTHRTSGQEGEDENEQEQTARDS